MEDTVAVKAWRILKRITLMNTLRNCGIIQNHFIFAVIMLGTVLKMNAAGLDISRFEHARKEMEEAILVLPGYKDALVLLPINKLIYKP